METIFNKSCMWISRNLRQNSGNVHAGKTISNDDLDHNHVNRSEHSYDENIEETMRTLSCEKSRWKTRSYCLPFFRTQLSHDVP